MHWISINQAKALVKQGFLKLEDGSLFDKQRNYVGSIENNRFRQNPNYQIPQYIIRQFENFDEDAWFNSVGGW